MAHQRLIVIAATTLLTITGFQSSVDADSKMEYEQYVNYQAAGAAAANSLWREGFQKAKKENSEFKHEYIDLTYHFAGRGESNKSGCGALSGDPGEFRQPNVNPAFHCARQHAAYFSSGWLYREYYLKIGDYAPFVIIAHELGHHVQRQVGMIDEDGNPLGWFPEKDIELNADCLAGVALYELERENYFKAGSSEQGAETVFRLGDKGYGARDPHGTPEERKDYFSAGYNIGFDECNKRLEAAAVKCNHNTADSDGDCDKRSERKPHNAR